MLRPSVPIPTASNATVHRPGDPSERIARETQIAADAELAARMEEEVAVYVDNANEDEGDGSTESRQVAPVVESRVETLKEYIPSNAQASSSRDVLTLYSLSVLWAFGQIDSALLRSNVRDSVHYALAGVGISASNLRYVAVSFKKGRRKDKVVAYINHMDGRNGLSSLSS